LSKIINKDFEEIGKRKLFNLILSNKEKISEYCLPTTIQWIEILFSAQNNQSTKEVPKINNFTLKIESNILTVREFQDNVYLCSPDFKTKIAVQSTNSLPFSNIGNNLGVYFEYNYNSDNWIMRVRNPNLIEQNS